jgi:hypothetical protein
VINNFKIKMSSTVRVNLSKEGRDQNEFFHDLSQVFRNVEADY